MKIVNFIERKMDIYKYCRRQKVINQHFSVGETSEYVQDAVKQLQTAREVIVNYAKAKGVKISIKSADSKEYPQMLDCLITDKKSKKAVKMLLAADTKKVYKHIVPRILHDPQEMIEYRAGNIAEHDDTFLRHFYRELAHMVDVLKPKR